MRRLDFPPFLVDLGTDLETAVRRFVESQIDADFSVTAETHSRSRAGSRWVSGEVLVRGQCMAVSPRSQFVSSHHKAFVDTISSLAYTAGPTQGAVFEMARLSGHASEVQRARSQLAGRFSRIVRVGLY